MNQPPPRDVPAWSTRQVVYATLFISAVLVAFALLYRFSEEIFILFVAIVLGTAIRPGVDWLNKRGVSRSAGVILIYILLIALLVGVMVSVVPLVIEQVAAISVDLPKYYGEFRNEIFQSKSRILQLIAIQLPPDLRLLPTMMAETGAGEEGAEGLNRVAQFLSYFNLITHGILILVAIFLLGFYWTLESERTIRSLSLWFPMDRRESVRELFNEIESKVGGFVIGQGLLCLVIGVLALVAYLLIQLPYALVLAILAGILEAVPVFGPILGAIPALLVALSTDPTKFVWVLVASVVIQMAENYLLVPRVMNRSVGVSPLVTLLALAAFTSLLGLVGALLAVPMAAIIQLLLDRLVRNVGQKEEEAPMGRDQLSVLRYETQDLTEDLQKQFREKDGQIDEIEDSIAAIASDLDRILTYAAQKEGEG